MNLVEKSLKIALIAHEGQRDKAGLPYILHPLRLMQKMHNELEMSSALLHDVLEDSHFTPEKLREEGIPEDVIDVLLYLTKKRNETYEEFIERASNNEIAVKVKKADLEDNINILRLKEVKDKDIERLKKYHVAWNKLNNR